MTEKRPVSLGKFGISDNAYRELYYFCLQYDEKKEMLKGVYGATSSVISGMPRGNGTSDTTFNAAARAMKLRKDIEVIEQAAIEADSSIYEYILNNVTRGIPYEYMNVPCGRRQFYEKRRMFFCILYLKRGNTGDVFL